MSKYTTEVRYICETYAGLEESVGYDSVDEVIDKSYLKIFNNDKIPMYKNETEAHRAGLLKKILLHYYTREIGYETVGLWKLKLNQKMIEIMPYYNQLYESAELEFDPFKNVDVTKTHEGEYNDDEKVDNLRNSESHRGTHTEHEDDTEIHKEIHTDVESDTTTDKDINTHEENDTEGHKDVNTQQVSDSETDKSVNTQAVGDVETNKGIHAEEDSNSNTLVTLRHSKTTSQGNDERTNDIQADGNSWVLFSDTPQGGIDGINAAAGDLTGNGYLTNATRTITTPDEQKVTQTHGTITETYNIDGDRTDTTVVTASVDTQTTENDTEHSTNATQTTENLTEHTTSATQTTENTTEHGEKDIQTTENIQEHHESETQTNEDTTEHNEGQIQTNENITGKITDDNAKNTNGTDSYINKDIGKIGTETYSEMLQKYRATFLNIDLMVIRELEKLFIGLW